MNSPTVKLSREELYKQIWKTPARVLAEQFDISDVGLAKACKRMGIPRPPRGYWRRKETGKLVKTIPLPPAKPTDQLTIEFHRASHPKHSATPRRDLITAELLQSFAQPHPLVDLTRRRLENGTASKAGLLVSTAKQRLDLTVSHARLERSLRLYDAILKAWEREGNCVLIGEGDSPPTLLRSGTESLQISIEEEIETVTLPPTETELLRPKWTWKVRTETRCKGSFKILLSGDRTEDWRPFVRRFRDGESSAIEKTAGRIVRAALDYLTDRRAYLEESERKQREREKHSKIEEARRKREEQERSRREAERKRTEAFFDAAKDWEKVKRYREFITECEKRMTESGAAPEIVKHWVAWAEEQVEGIDPLAGGYLEPLLGDGIYDYLEPR